MDKHNSSSKNQLIINSANYLLKRKKFLLDFEPFDIEQDYRERRIRHTGYYVKTFLAFGGSLTFLVVTLVAVYWPELFTSREDSPFLKINLVMNVAIVFIVPIIIALMRNESMQQVVIAFASIIFLTWKCTYPHIIEDHSFSSNTLHLSVIYLIMGSFLTRLRTLYALFTYLSIALLTLFFISTVETNQTLNSVDYIYATAITCTIAFFFAAYQEHSLRTNYLKSIILKTQQKELERLNQSYIRLSKEDPLTGLANRRLLKERLEGEWQRLQRDGGPISIVMFDIDCFKAYNDHYGHQKGDSCLVQIAACINSVIKRPTDLPARYGGEEFIVVLPNTNEAGGIKVAESIKNAVERCAIENIASNIKSIITLTLGVATLFPETDTDKSTKTLIKLADDALYQGKAQGKDQIVVAKKEPSIVTLKNNKPAITK